MKRIKLQNIFHFFNVSLCRGSVKHLSYPTWSCSIFVIDQWHLFAPHREHKTPSNVWQQQRRGNILFTKHPILSGIFWHICHSNIKLSFAPINGNIHQEISDKRIYSKSRARAEVWKRNEEKSMHPMTQTHVVSLSTKRVHICVCWLQTGVQVGPLQIERDLLNVINYSFTCVPDCMLT